MIVDAFLVVIKNFVYVIGRIVSALLPVAQMPTEVANSLTAIRSYYSSFDQFIPLTLLGLLLTAIFAIEVAVLSYKVAMWWIKRIPTQS